MTIMTILLVNAISALEETTNSLVGAYSAKKKFFAKNITHFLYFEACFVLIITYFAFRAFSIVIVAKNKILLLLISRNNNEKC